MHCGITVRNRRKLTFIASKRPYWFLLIFLFLLLILEEWRFGLVYRFYFNTYRTVVYRPIDARRTASNRQEIAIVSIVHNNSNSRDYLLAQSTTRYFIMHMWKEKYRNAHIYLGWFTPFAVDPLASTAACDLFASAQLNWQYKDTFITPVNEIRKKLSNVFGSAYQWHLDRIKTLEHMYPIDEYYHGKH
ncbi:hypothetical protein M3Y96_01231400 [Aphelenchoides besseyi]|nr:hypothetical protein M3Y96_01231400 [Aphelenchoides besseyi]